MSRRKQSRPRHVDNDGLGLGVGGEEGAATPDLGLGEHTRKEDVEETLSSIKRINEDNNEDDDENTEEFGTSSEMDSTETMDNNISSCDKCGICFSDVRQFLAHKKICGSHNRILMPYDPPVNGYALQNGYGLRRHSLDGSVGKDLSDAEDRDDGDSAEDEERTRLDNEEYDNGNDKIEGRKRRRDDEDEDEIDNEEDNAYRSQLRSDENFLLGLRNRMVNSLQNLQDKGIKGKEEIPEVGQKDNEESFDREDDEKAFGAKRKKMNEEENETPRPGVSGKSDDPAVAWAMKALERDLFSGNSNVTLEPLAATNAAVAQVCDSLASRDNLPEEVNMFRSMLYQLQQQQMMQIQMIQQMRRQLIASVNPSLVPDDVDLNMMSNESLAAMGGTMSGILNPKAVTSGNQDSGNARTSNRYIGVPRSPSHGGRSRESSPSPSDAFPRGGEPLSPHATGKSSDKDTDRLRDGNKSQEEQNLSNMDISGKYLSHRPFLDSPKDPVTSSPMTKNPLEILQERTAASLSSLPLPPGMKQSPDRKPPSSSSSLLNSSALFASSPSLSALQKETDALKPSPILPPISIPMTAEDYKGYIQRGTILERSQYASDDPFFKHKCRFCHKVFGSDSALQIHVRSHTGERPFKCNICGNRFSTKGNLKVHFERHKAKYPQIKMDATPVPEHLDRHPNMMPNIPPTPIPPSVPLPPPIPRMPIPSAPHLPPPSPSPSSSHGPVSHHSPFPVGFGENFLNSVGHGMSPFGLMPPPRDGSMHFHHPLSMSLPSSIGMPLSFGRDSMARRESFTKVISGSSETSVIKSPRKESPVGSNRDVSPSNLRKCSTPVFHPHLPQDRESHHRHHSEMSEGYNSDENPNDHEDSIDRNDMPSNDKNSPRSRHDTEKSRSQSPVSRKSSTVSTPTVTPSSPPPLARPPSSHSPRQSPASVISWASLSSSQASLLPSHHPPLFPPHPTLPPGFPGLSLPCTPTSFPLPSPLNPVLPMSGPRVSGHSPFLPPPPPPPPQIPTPPGEASMFRNSILPTKTIDPSENLEQYMEVQKSETSKLEALVKNIEQKITDPNQCVVCHRVLSCKSALQMHYRIHTGERPFKCKICGRSFTTKGNLKTHMGVHRAKPALRMMHQCPVCHKQFTNVLVLQQHIRAHTGSMQHMPHMPLLPSHMDWAHRSPFGLNRHHPYLPPMHADSHSLDLSKGGAPMSSGHLHRIRSQSMDSEHQPELFSPKKERPEKYDEPDDADDKEDFHDEKSPNQENSPRPHSRDGQRCEDKDRLTSSRPHSAQEDSSSSKIPFTKSAFESNFLPPSFGNTPFDAPLAALEERVKAIDSQLSQTSFEKFRNSMGLDSTFYPNSASSTSLSNGEKNSEYGSESASKPDSPSSGADLPRYDLTMFGGFDGRSSTTCNICLKTFACKSALDIHYRSHTKLKPFLCDVCEKSFSTKGNLRQHLLTHKIRDLPDSAFDDADQSGDKALQQKNDGDESDIDDDDELPNEDYPFEEDGGMEGIEMETELDQSGDMDDLNEDFNEDAEPEDPSSPSKSFDASQEDNNNLSNFQNHNGDEKNESADNETVEDEKEPNDLPNPTSEHHKTNTLKPVSDSPSITNSQSATTENMATSSAGNSSSTSGQRSQNNSSSSQNNSPARSQNGPKHQCMTCMKPFSSASALQIHTRTHTGDKPFKCTVCSKAFTTRGNLKVHMGTHVWNNSPSRRGRRMSIEPPFYLSHMKDNPFMPTGFPPRPPPDFFYHYPLPMMNGPGSKMNEISVIQSLGALPTLPPVPPHLMQGFLPKDERKINRDARPPSESSDHAESQSDQKSSGELDLSMKAATEVSLSRTSTSTPSSSLSVSVHPPTSSMSTTSSSTPSPSNNKENSSATALDLRNMRAAPWPWGTFPCHHCGQMFPGQDLLEHHIRTHHLSKSESSSHPLSKTDSHPPPAPKALLA